LRVLRRIYAIRREEVHAECTVRSYTISGFAPNTLNAVEARTMRFPMVEL
jgi:hypothetical protein